MTDSMQERMREKLARGLQPLVLEIVNESAKHAGHMGDDGSGETHYRVVIVSDAFTGKSRVDRQRMVYDLLAYEMQHGIHALSVKALLVSEYNKM